MAITIDKKRLEEILVSIGFPIVTLDDIGLSEAQIKDYIIYPAMREFYKWFPIKNPQTYTVGNSFTIDFPNANTFNVVDVRMIPYKSSGNTITGNIFVDQSFINFPQRGGRYGTPYNYDSEIANVYQRMEQQSYIDYGKAVKFNVDEVNKQLKGYVNANSTISVTWAEYSDNFNTVPYNFIYDVIRLSQANLLRFLGNLRNQTSEIDISGSNVSGDNFITEADRLEELIMERWRGLSKVVLIRG